MVVEKQKLKYFPGEFTVRCFVSTSNEDYVYSECYFKETNVITSVHLKSINNNKKIVKQVDILLYSLF